MSDLLGGGGGDSDLGRFNPFDPGSKLLHDIGFSDEAVLGISTIADPLDIFGTRATFTRGTIEDLLTSSTQEGLAEQRRQLEQLEQLNAPFRDVALEQSLPSLTALATGQGETGFQPSRLFQLQAEQGTRGIKRRLAAQGKLGSSQRFEETADLISGLAGEDIARFEAGNLAQLQAGIGSTEALSRAGTTLGAAGSALLSNLGAQQNIAAQNFGAQRQSSFQGAANTLGGLSSLLNQPGGV